VKKTLILTTIFILAGGITLSSIMVSAQEDYNIPAWIKNNAGWWADGQIDDASFVSGITYMIENGIMEISQNIEQGYTPAEWATEENLVRYMQANTELRSELIEAQREIDLLSEQLQAAQVAKNTGSASVEKLLDDGDFFIVYVLSDNYSDYETWVKNGMNNYPNFFDEQADWLNENFNLPYDVPIFFHECGMTNAYYSPSEKQIVICYELVQDYHSKLASTYSHMGEDYINYATLSAVDYVFYHEMAHALIDIYDLKITGLEEDVADQFSTYILTDFGNDGEDTNVGSDEIQFAAIVNALSHSDAQLQLSVFADTHSLNIQRFYNLACYAYGYDPVYNENLIKDGFLPAHRAVYCAGEYDQIKNSWDILLTPYLK